MRRSVKPLKFERWRAERTPEGRWTVRDDQGNEPLSHPDPLVQLERAHQIAQLPALLAVFAEWLGRLRRLEMSLGENDVRDRFRIYMAECVMADTHPPLSEQLRIAELQGKEDERKAA